MSIKMISLRPLPLCLVFYSRHHADVGEFSRTIPIVADAPEIVKYYLHFPLLYPYRLKFLTIAMVGKCFNACCYGVSVFLGSVLANCPHDSMAVSIVSTFIFFYFSRGVTDRENVVNNTTITGVKLRRCVDKWAQILIYIYFYPIYKKIFI